jgi:hypothetical protein
VIIDVSEYQDILCSDGNLLRHCTASQFRRTQGQCASLRTPLTTSHARTRRTEQRALNPPSILCASGPNLTKFRRVSPKLPHASSTSVGRATGYRPGFVSWQRQETSLHVTKFRFDLCDDVAQWYSICGTRNPGSTRKHQTDPCKI